MRITVKHCDRCGACFTDQPGSVIEVKAGELAHQLPETLDLCTDCQGLFCDWLRSGHHASHVELGQALETKGHSLPVASATSL